MTDLRWALRNVRHSPGFATAVVVFGKVSSWNYADGTSVETSQRVGADKQNKGRRQEQHDRSVCEKRLASTRAVDERHPKRHEVVAAERQRVGEFATVEALHERVQQQQASEVHGDAFESVDVGRRLALSTALAVPRATSQ